MGVELHMNKVVPLLEHPKCPGSIGTVSRIDPGSMTFTVTCNNCHNTGVMIDFVTMARRSELIGGNDETSG